MTTSSSVSGHERQARLIALAAEVRPELHRYCARLMGSIIDGEDVVQDTLLRALVALQDVQAVQDMPPLRPWLFRIAHNRALDLLRARSVRIAESIDEAPEPEDPAQPDPVETLMHRQAIGTAVSRFAELPVPQRSVVVLKDVMGESLADIAALLEVSVDAVKAHLARGRARLRRINADGPAGSNGSAGSCESAGAAGAAGSTGTAGANSAASAAATAAAAPSPLVARFVALFNARDWDALRALLADDVKLAQSTHSLRVGRAEVGMFFGIYAQSPAFRLAPGWLEGQEVVAVFEPPGDPAPAYIMWLAWDKGRIAFIRDYRYVRYVMADPRVELAGRSDGDDPAVDSGDRVR